MKKNLTNQKSSSCGVALFAGGREAGRGKGEGGREQENLARCANHFLLLTISSYVSFTLGSFEKFSPPSFWLGWLSAGTGVRNLRGVAFYKSRTRYLLLSHTPPTRQRKFVDKCTYPVESWRIALRELHSWLLRNGVALSLKVCDSGTLTPDQISTFFNIWRHKCPLLIQSHKLPPQTDLVPPSTHYSCPVLIQTHRAGRHFRTKLMSDILTQAKMAGLMWGFRNLF